MASNKPVWQTVSIKPFLGTLDTRSETEDVPSGAFRWKQNLQMTGGTKLCRRYGHDKLLSSYQNLALSPPVYTNYDFHDQGNLANGPATVSEMITLIFPAQYNSGQRVLYAATQSQIAWLNETTGYWTQVGGTYGGTPQTGLPSTRFRADELQQNIMFTNNVDPPMYSAVGSTTTTVPSTLTTLTVTKALIAIEYSGFMFLMNVFQNGELNSARVRWSDLNDATYWLPAPAINPTTGDVSLAGFQDLNYGSQILGACVMAGNLYIYTTRAIWICYPTGANLPGGSAATFAFTQIYADLSQGAKCLAYPNTLVCNGLEVYYASTDGIYRHDPYLPQPVRDEWLYRGSSTMFNDDLSAMSPLCCESPFAGIFTDDEEIYMSFPEVSANPTGGCVNSKTIIFNYHYQSVDICDTGYSAFGSYQPNASTLLGCPPSALFIGASCTDNSLKSIGGIFSRAVCTNALTGQGKIVSGAYIPFVGTYNYVGYYSIIRGLLPLLNFDREKFIRHLLIEINAATQATPCILECRIGSSYSDADPNLPDGLCTVLWWKLPPLVLQCPASRTGKQYVAANLMPSKAFEWVLYHRGRFLYYEFRIANADGTAAIGGNACFQRLEAQIRLAPPS